MSVLSDRYKNSQNLVLEFTVTGQVVGAGLCGVETVLGSCCGLRRSGFGSEDQYDCNS